VRTVSSFLYLKFKAYLALYLAMMDLPERAPRFFAVIILRREENPPYKADKSFTYRAVIRVISYAMMRTGKKIFTNICMISRRGLGLHC
jgi:hypothetical protein